MFSNYGSQTQKVFIITCIGVTFGILAGFGVAIQPIIPILLIFVIGLLVYFFSCFEQAVLTLLVLRSSLDPFSPQQIPAAFGIALNSLTLLYIVIQLINRRPIKTDKFFWFFASWVLFQSLWVILPALGWGLGPAYVAISIREWVRIFSWLMVYLLVMQLKDRMQPEKAITTLFFSLIVPLTVGLMQIVLPPSILPPFLVLQQDGLHEVGSRIVSTLGHPSAVGTFMLIFISITLWKLGEEKEKKWLWATLLATLVSFLLVAKTLTSLLMCAVFIISLICQRLNFTKLIGGVIFLVIVIGIFANTDFGQQRLLSLYNTPLLNPSLDISRTILLSFGDGNSLNWRIAQWAFLIEAWQKSPFFGYGMAMSGNLTLFEGFYAHNDYIRFLAEEGIIGFTSFLIFITVIISRLWQIYKNALPHNSGQRNLCSIMIAMFMAILAGMSFDNIWNHTTFFFYWWLIFAVLGWQWNKAVSY
jgi:O-antigen ligase